MNLEKIMAIVRKDLSYYFVSPIGYIVLAMYYFVTGFFFWLIAAGSKSANMAPVFQNSTVIFLFLTPIVTMRLWSEEEKTGTSELLRTSPLSLWEIVLGKYFAAICFFLVMLAVNLVYLLIMAVNGNPDPGPTFCDFFGYTLAGMAFFSLGLLASTLSENQIVSAVITFGTLLMLYVIGAASNNVPDALGAIFKYISIFEHLNDFFIGVIDLNHVIYFLSVTFLGLFLSVKVMESKRS